MKEKFFTTKNITVTAALTAISFVLYMFVKFPLPFMFPQWLDVQFSEMPAMIGGFMMGPVWGSVVIIVKCLIKMPFTSTACVGELGDMIMGVALVIPSSLIYRRFRSKRGAVLALIVGTLSETAVAVLVNGLVLIPFYAKAFGWDAIVGMIAELFPNITRESFYAYYLPLSVLPFNLMRLSVCSLVTFFVYKHLHRLIDRMFAPKKKTEPADSPAEAVGDGSAEESSARSQTASVQK